MGLFGRKKLKFFQMGMLVGMACPCGNKGLMTGYYDSDIPGHESDELLRCWECGSVYLGYPDGKFLQVAYTGEDRVPYEEWYQKHHGDG